MSYAISSKVTNKLIIVLRSAISIRGKYNYSVYCLPSLYRIIIFDYLYSFELFGPHV